MTRIVQLTDLHLTARKGRRVRGSDVWANLDQTLAHVRSHVGDFDRLVLTGDLANSGSAEAYARLADVLAPWHSRLRLVPGNHDHRERLRAAFPAWWPPGRPSLCFHDHAGGYRLIGLDSVCQGRTRGQLGRWQLDWLAQQLRSERDPVLLFLHHPPERVHCWWLDKDLLRDRAELATITAPCDVRAIFAGHVHQENHTRSGGAEVWTTPAVAYEYRPGSWLPLACSRQPAFRIIEAGPTTISSRVVRPWEHRSGGAAEWR
jgi:Icc protein